MCQLGQEDTSTQGSGWGGQAVLLGQPSRGMRSLGEAAHGPWSQLWAQLPVLSPCPFRLGKAEISCALLHCCVTSSAANTLVVSAGHRNDDSLGETRNPMAQSHQLSARTVAVADTIVLCALGREPIFLLLFL